jgi:hypothetical protein
MLKLNILSNMIFMSSFIQAVNYIASAIDMTTKNSSTTARQISELNCSGSSNSGRGRGRGRDSGCNAYNRGHSRGQGRGRNAYGGRGRNSQDNNSLTSLGSRRYNPQEWQALSSHQKQEVYS